MKLTRCMHNHYYDGSKHSVCPQCVEKGLLPAPASGMTGKREEESRHQAASALEIEKSVHSLHPPIAPDITASAALDTKTTDFINGFWAMEEPTPRAEPVNANVQVEMAESAQEEGAQEVLDKNSFWEQSMDHTDGDTDSALPQDDGAQSDLYEDNTLSSLKEAVLSVSQASAFEDTKTVAFYHTAALEPVVGWLVALNGTYAGESFPLRTGRNHIGRWPKMDVALTKEPSVSRDRHAILTYDPKSRTYFIQPGEGNGLTYQNEQILLSPQALSDGDILQLGDCKLLFKALCVGSFTWDTYL